MHQDLWRQVGPVLFSIFVIIAVAVLIRALDAIKAFDLIYTLSGGGPGSSTETLSYYIYKVGFQFFRLGYGAALSFILLIALSVLLTFLLRYLKAVWR